MAESLHLALKWLKAMTIIAYEVLEKKMVQGQIIPRFLKTFQWAVAKDHEKFRNL